MSNPDLAQVPQNNHNHKKGRYATKLRIPHDSYDYLDFFLYSDKSDVSCAG